MTGSGTFQKFPLERSRNGAAAPPPIYCGAVNPAQTSRPPTVHDVARAAGVSKSAVSLAVRNQKGLSEATRQHILSVAQELGYRSNVWARSLVQGRSGLVGVLLQDLGNSYHRDVTAGVEDAAAEQDLRLVIGHGRRDAAKLRTELDSLLALGVEGVVIVSSWLPPQALEEIARRVPLVVAGRLPELVSGVDSVANHDEIGARLAVEHLTELGHERIIHLTGSARPAAMHRQATFREVMREHVPGIEPRVEGPQRVDAAVRHVIFQLREEKAPPTAVFTQNDRVAADLVGACLDAGVSIPGQLSVVGYDNSSICRMLRPQLTSVDQPRQQMGRMALEMLSQRLAGRSEDLHERLSPQLVVRSSTGVPGT